MLTVKNCTTRYVLLSLVQEILREPEKYSELLEYCKDYDIPNPERVLEGFLKDNFIGEEN